MKTEDNFTPESVCGIPTLITIGFVLEILFYSKQLKNFD
jgi:hypothetical protein